MNDTSISRGNISLLNNDTFPYRFSPGSPNRLAEANDLKVRVPDFRITVNEPESISFRGNTEFADQLEARRRNDNPMKYTNTSFNLRYGNRSSTPIKNRSMYTSTKIGTTGSRSPVQYLNKTDVKTGRWRGEREPLSFYANSRPSYNYQGSMDRWGPAVELESISLRNHPNLEENNFDFKKLDEEKEINESMLNISKNLLNMAKNELRNIQRAKYGYKGSPIKNIPVSSVNETMLTSEKKKLNNLHGIDFENVQTEMSSPFNVKMDYTDGKFTPAPQFNSKADNTSLSYTNTYPIKRLDFTALNNKDSPEARKTNLDSIGESKNLWDKVGQQGSSSRTPREDTSSNSARIIKVVEMNAEDDISEKSISNPDLNNSSYKMKAMGIFSNGGSQNKAGTTQKSPLRVDRKVEDILGRGNETKNNIQDTNNVIETRTTTKVINSSATKYPWESPKFRFRDQAESEIERDIVHSSFANIDNKILEKSPGS